MIFINSESERASSEVKRIGSEGDGGMNKACTHQAPSLLSGCRGGFDPDPTACKWQKKGLAHLLSTWNMEHLGKTCQTPNSKRDCYSIRRTGYRLKLKRIGSKEGRSMLWDQSTRTAAMRGQGWRGGQGWTRAQSQSNCQAG